jgi:caffeoyl-CoA O-methyltransferase
MFHSIPSSILEQMQRLEAIDARDRNDGTPRLQRLRQIPPETGRFLAILAASAPAGDFVEIGTSAGYSALWLALACRATGRQLITFEVLPEKVALAQQTFQAAGVEDVIRLVYGDARRLLTQHENIAFCFLDAEKEVYGECYDIIVPRLAKGGLLVGDNFLSHPEALGPVLERSQNDERLDAVLVPIGKGELVCRRI